MTPFKFAYLEPLFEDIVGLREEGAYRQLPAPQASSSLATDDAPLGMYSASTLIRSSFTAGVAHADALRRLVLHGEVDPTSPWTLLRGALENFATGVWLLSGSGRSERRRRALSLWDEDMRNRHQHERDTGYQPDVGGMTGAQRRGQIRAIADRLSLAPLTAPKANQVLLDAAPAAGLTAVKVCATWRAASGFAHGRYWPNLRVSMPIDAVRGGPDHYLAALVIDESEHRKLAQYTRALLQNVQARYLARSTTH
ncbi:hypothetical protein [Streptomyces lavendulocolor]|uniref:hypothetical protein n=1 Tax=Streptomyces lavendulocolor TaxID=67316 RepID=UPI003C2CBF95